ncbi:MAG: hypothetical protein V7754_10445 [Halioglobus sp.]
MNKALRVVVALTALLFVMLGIRWLVDPAGSAAGMGMPLLEGIGRSTQIGDLGAFFFGGGVMVIIGLLTNRRSWFYAPTILIASTALFRVIAWLAHDAAFATEQIAVEVIVTALLLAAASRLADKA